MAIVNFLLTVMAHCARKAKMVRSLGPGAPLPYGRRAGKNVARFNCRQIARCSSSNGARPAIVALQHAEICCHVTVAEQCLMMNA